MMIMSCSIGPASREVPRRPPRPAHRTPGVGWLVLVALLITLVGRGVQAAPPDDPAAAIELDRLRSIWRTASVVWPVEPLGSAQLAARLDARVAMLEGRRMAPSVRGVVELDADHAAGVWISALETVRVRQFGEAVPLRFIQIVDANLALIEPGRAAAPGPAGEHRFELTQPASVGAMWSIEADAPTRVLIERVEDRDPRYVAVEVEHDVLEWIANGSPIERTPALLEPADASASRLRLDAALAQELVGLGPTDPALERAVAAWQMLAGFAALDLDSSTARPYAIHDRERDRPLPLAGTREVELLGTERGEYRSCEGPRGWTVEARGPGRLRIAARSWAPVGVPLAPASLQIRAGGRILAQLELSDRAARPAVDPEAALPRFEPLLTAAGEPVGELATLTLILAPGEHDYEIELIGGPALLSVERVQRSEASMAAVKGWTPTKRARAAERGLRRSKSSAAPWLELLLAEHTLAPLAMAPEDPRLDELGQRSPLLASVVASLVASDEHLDPSRLDRLVAQVRPWLATLDRNPAVDPIARARVRTRWLALLAIHGRPELAPELVEAVSGGVDPIAELPVEGLRLLAEMMVATPETTRSSALALLELARARAPADRSLRTLTLRLWSSSTRWSKRRPEPSEPAADPFGPIGEWLVPQLEPVADVSQTDRGWTRLEPGQAIDLVAAIGPAPVRSKSDTSDPGRRLRLLDIYVATPPGDPAPVGIRVDERRWWSPQLIGVMRHRIAVAPGVHEVELEVPPNTRAWASLPPADGPSGDPSDAPVGLARLEQMWSLPDSTWSMPGPALPGMVRLELRWPVDLPPRPVRIEVIEEGASGVIGGRTILFDPRTTAAAVGVDRGPSMLVDPEAVAIYGSVPVSPRHDLRLPIAATTTSLRFEVEDDLPIAAGLSLRRGLQADELGGAAGVLVNPAIDPRFDAVFGDLPALAGDALEAELSTLSRQLLAAPHELDLRARRAALLMMIGETGLARADMILLADQAEQTSVAADRRGRADALLHELQVRLGGLLEPREIVVTAAKIGDEPELIEPAIAAIVGDDRASLDPWLATFARARTAAVDEALVLVDARIDELGDNANDRILLLGALARAHWLARDPEQAREAGRVWLELYGRIPGVLGVARQPIAVAVAAVEPLILHLGDPRSDARDASVAYGFAAELEPHYGHSSVRRLAAIAAQRSGWTTLDHSENNAGFEVLELPVSKLDRSLSDRIRFALLAAPWAGATSEQLRPNRKGVLAWDADPGSVTAQLWCREVRVDRRSASAIEDPHAHVQVRLIGAAEAAIVELEVEVGDGELREVVLPIASAGRQQLELSLAEDPRWLCAWRAQTRDRDATRGELVEARRSARWWIAHARAPVEFTVLGPTTLLFESRAVTHANERSQPTSLHVEVERVGVRKPSAAIETGEWAVDVRPELAVITERRHSFEVGYTDAHTVVLTESGPHRVTLRSDRGRVLIRARMRGDRDDAAPPDRVAIRKRSRPPESIAAGHERGDPERSARLGLAPILAHDEVTPIRNRFGSFDGQVRIGLDELGDAADLAVRFGVSASLGWRRELIDDALWLRLATQLRTREGSPAAGGGQVGLAARVPKIDLRLGADLEVLAHEFDARSHASVRFSAFVDRPTWLSRRLQLLPRLTAGVRWQSLDPERVDAATTLLMPHPRVYQQYIHDHPLLLRPELALRAYPFRDLALWARTSLLPNSDLRSLDHINLELGFDGIGRQPHQWVPLWGASYQASLRFDSLGEPFYVRHGVKAELGLAVWILDAVRMAAGVRNEVYGSRASPLRDVIELWVRIDAAFGRRMRDHGPGDTWFAEPWAPQAWADDEHQARSTQGRLRSE
jgi:hypothetical protein